MSTTSSSHLLERIWVLIAVLRSLSEDLLDTEEDVNTRTNEEEHKGLVVAGYLLGRLRWMDESARKPSRVCQRELWLARQLSASY